MCDTGKLQVAQCGVEDTLSRLAGDEGSDGKDLIEEVSKDDADDLRDEDLEDPLDDNGSGTGAD